LSTFGPLDFGENKVGAVTMQNASQQNPEYRGSDASGDSLLLQSAPISLPR